MKSTTFRISGIPLFILSVYILMLSTAAANAQNPVVMENKKAGTTNWILDKVRADTCRLLKPYKADLFCRQQDIEGYCSKTSVKAGETLNVFVSANPESSFTVDIYRMGYYGGNGRKKNAQYRPVKRFHTTYSARWRKKSPRL
jgi:hypothetical protein